MTNLVAFLRARLDEDEAAAGAASQANPPPWEATRGYLYGQETEQNRYLDGGLWDNEGAELLSMEPATAAHIARWDPARALAEVAAKRAILDEIVPTVEAHDSQISSEWGGPDAGTADDLLKLLALPYADHPDYREEWKP